MAKLITKTYGGALFEIAVEKQMTDTLYEEAVGVKEVFDSNADLHSFLGHPDIEVSEKVHVVENIFSGRVSAEMVGFLMTVVSKGRYAQLDSILEYFCTQMKEYKNIGTAFVTSAYELSEQQKAQVEQKLIATTKYESFEMNYSVDASLIGGIVIRIGDKVVDGSVRNKLNTLQKDLMKTSVAK